MRHKPHSPARAFGVGQQVKPAAQLLMVEHTTGPGPMAANAEVASTSIVILKSIVINAHVATCREQHHSLHEISVFVAKP